MKPATCPQDTCPVVVECYDEIAFPDPSEAFLARVQCHPAVNFPRLRAGLTVPPTISVEDASKRRRGDTKNHSLCQCFMNFSEADELLQLAAARQQLFCPLNGLGSSSYHQTQNTDGQHQQFKSSSEF